MCIFIILVTITIVIISIIIITITTTIIVIIVTTICQCRYHHRSLIVRVLDAATAIMIIVCINQCMDFVHITI